MTEKHTKVSRVWRSQLRRFAAYIAACIACVVLSSYLPGSIIKGKLFGIGSTVLYLSLPLFCLIPLYALGYLMFPIYDAIFKIDNKGIEMKKGILSLSQRIVRVRYQDIRSIELDQTILERILNTGKLGIGSAATGNVEIVMDGIGSPKELQAMIQEERDRRIKSQPKNSEQARAMTG